MPVPTSSQRAQILGLYRELLRLISRQPPERAAAAREEARSTLRARKAETNPEQLHLYHKELASRVSFLRITTPRTPGQALQGGRYVLRDGELVEGAGADKGARWVKTSRPCMTLTCSGRWCYTWPNQCT